MFDGKLLQLVKVSSMMGMGETSQGSKEERERETARE
jgi:hypothetical protein